MLGVLRVLGVFGEEAPDRAGGVQRAGLAAGTGPVVVAPDDRDQFDGTPGGAGGDRGDDRTGDGPRWRGTVIHGTPAGDQRRHGRSVDLGWSLPGPAVVTDIVIGGP